MVCESPLSSRSRKRRRSAGLLAAEVRHAIEAAGALPIYLPTYSPELNPIEPLWADLKRGLRRMGFDTVEMLRWAPRRLCAALPLHRIDGWVRGALAEAQIK